MLLINEKGCQHFVSSLRADIIRPYGFAETRGRIVWSLSLGDDGGAMKLLKDDGIFINYLVKIIKGE